MNIFIILLNRGINILKYPIALIFALLTFELTIILSNIVESMYQNQTHYKHFFMGMGAYIGLWIIIFNKSRENWFLTIEHELTHTLFALLTFHKILNFQATNSHGGHVQFSGVGGGNWLIIIAPYFFPTFSMIIIGFIYISQSQYYPFLIGLLGYTIIYHIHSTYKETSLQQSDIQEVGFPFAFLFLPSANLLAIIGILSAIPNDKIIFLKIIEALYYHLLFYWNELNYLTLFQ